MPDDTPFQSYSLSDKPLTANPPKPSPYNIPLFDVEEVQSKIDRSSTDDALRKQKKTLEIMAATGGVARLRKQPRNFTVILNKLAKEYPHFVNVITFLKKRMVLNSLKKHPHLDFGASLLLTGPAGVGKSSFLFKLAELMNTEFYSYSCAATSGAFGLVGLSSTWGNGRYGKLHEILVNKQCPNPIILLDEVEKVATNDNRFSTLSSSLYGLLEKNNARYFRDEFVDQQMDASRINWFATANDVELLDPSILDRFHVVQIRVPTSSELEKMIPNLYVQAITELGVKEHFNMKLDPQVVRLLSCQPGTSIRKIKSAICGAISNAAEGRVKGKDISLQIKDLDLEEWASKNPMGYIWSIGGEHSQMN